MRSLWAASRQAGRAPGAVLSDTSILGITYENICTTAPYTRLKGKKKGGIGTVVVVGKKCVSVGSEWQEA